MYSVTILFLLPILIIFSRPDFVIMEPDLSILGSIPSILISKLKRVKFVLDIRSTPVETVGLRGSLQKTWFSVSVLIAKKLFDGMTIITCLMKNEVCRDFDLNPEKVGVWTTGVSEALFNPESSFSGSPTLRKKLKVEGKFIVFYHGVLAATRGLTETIKAIEILEPTHPEVVFFLLGSGPAASKLKALVQQEGLQRNVIIHDPVDQSKVPEFIDMSDVCIVPLPNHPYWRFQCSLKLLEYLAMEKVVIVTDIPAHRSIIGEERCGIYVSSAEPEEIAKAIECAYSKKENLEEWGKSGREIIKDKYTWKKVARDLENYLLSISERTDLV
jgi:glycosyltransferase involved in cell wall biosynthesis